MVTRTDVQDGSDESISMDTDGAQKIRSFVSYLLWLAWGLFLIGLVLPVFNLPFVIPQLGPLLFFGLPVPNAAPGGGVEVADWIPVDGGSFALLLIENGVLRLSMDLAGVVVLMFAMPIMLAMISPLLIWVRFRIVPFFCALAFAEGFGLMFLIFAFKKSDAIINIGYGFWLGAFLLLAISSLALSFLPRRARI